MSNKVSFFLVNFYRGGGEKVALELARGFYDRGHEVDMVVMNESGPYRSQVPQGVKVVCLERTSFLKSLMPLVKYLKREKPRALISISKHPHLLTIWARMLSGVSTKIILRLGIPFSHKGNKNNIGEIILPLLVKVFYPFADYIVANSEYIKKDFQSVVRVKDSKMKMIYSPKHIDEIRELSREEIDIKTPFIVSVGRLTFQKGFDVLVKAFARSEIEGDLIIIGEGEEREPLMELAETLGVGERCKILGFEENPYKYLSKAKVFVSSSRWEGMPNALLEAMICGTSVIASDIDPSIELLSLTGSEEYIYELDNVEKLAELLRGDVKQDNSKIVEYFDHETIIREYEKLV